MQLAHHASAGAVRALRTPPVQAARGPARRASAARISFVRDRSMVEDAELRGGLERPAPAAVLRRHPRGRPASAATCERIASELRAESAENRLVERGTPIRHGLLCALPAAARSAARATRCRRLHRGVFAPTELASLWHLPSIDYTTVPFARGATAARAGAAGDPAPARRGPGRCATRSDRSRSTPRAAQAEHGRAGNRRAGQVELPDRDRRRGSAARALCGDRARPQGRRRRRRGQPRAAGSARARCSTSPTRRAASTRSPSTRPPT